MASLQHFLHMGGYGFYVWTAYGSAFLLLGALLATTRGSNE